MKVYAFAVARTFLVVCLLQWQCPMELYGVGKYAADAYYMFCRGEWHALQPDDKDLTAYHEWLKATGGLGTGLTR